MFKYAITDKQNSNKPKSQRLVVFGEPDLLN